MNHVANLNLAHAYADASTQQIHIGVRFFPFGTIL